jgi:Flp pilus assembly pilin Flp
MKMSKVFASAVALVSLVSLVGCDSGIADIVNSTFSADNITNFLTSIFEAITSALTGA